LAPPVVAAVLSFPPPMIPELFRIGDFAISPFGVMMVAAFLASYFHLLWGFRRLGIGGEDDASAIIFAAGVGGIVGSKVYYAILYGDWRLLLDRAGLVWYGGFILATLLVLWVMRRRRLPFASTLDVAMSGVPLGYALGRVGCFLVGDDYGMPTDQPWGVVFPHGLPRTTAGNLRAEFGADIPASVPFDQLMPVHPTQLYETLAGFTIWFVGISMLRRRARPGATALVCLALLAVERFLVEFLRAKDDRFFGGLTLAQVISLITLAVAFAIWMRWRRRGRSAEEAA